MIALGITGGPATGKSTVTRAVRGVTAAMAFDADAEVHRLLANDEAIRGAVCTAFGGDAFDSSGQIDRARLRERVFASPQDRARLETILHPPVLASLRHAMAEARERATCNLFLADVPLLFETGADRDCDAVVVAACSPNVQHERLAGQRQLDPKAAGRVIAAQWPLERKIERADYVIWTECVESILLGQVSELLALLGVSVSQTHD